jgi:P-type Cu+ transporter
MDTAVKTPAAPGNLTFQVQGMTCASCVARVEKALKAVPGVKDASVNLATEKATVSADVGTGFNALAAAVEKAGYTVPEETVSLAIDGMTCASCVARIEKALMKVPGVMQASVNLATEKAEVTASVGVTAEALIAAVEKAGYRAAVPTDTAPSPKAGATLPTWWPVALSALLSVPLFAPMLGLLFGQDWMLPG